MRIKSLLVVLLILVCMFCAVDAMASDKAEQAAQFLQQLGITDGIDISSTRNVTRDEFTAMVIRAMNMEDIAQEGDSFSDILDNPYSGEIYLAKALGITNGTSATTFSPKEEVSFGVASKMLVTALGHSHRAEVKGGFPTGYMVIADGLDLYNGLTDMSGAVTVEDMCVLLYNMLGADLAVTATATEDYITYTTAENTCILSEYFKLSHTVGVITTAGIRTVNSSITEPGIIEINGIKLKSNIDVSDYLGYKAEVWYDKNDERAYAVFPDAANSVKILSGWDDTDYSNYVLSVTDANSGKEEYSFEKSFSFVLNGRGCSDVESNIEFDAGSILLIDNDNDRKYEFVLANRAEYFVIDSVSSIKNSIHDPNSSLLSVSFDEPEDVDYEIVIDGVISDFSQLTKNMVCMVYISENKDFCRVEANSKSTQIATIEATSDDYVYIEGKEYKTNSYFNTVGVILTPGVGYELLIAPDGTITDVIGFMGSELLYGYLIGYAPSSGFNKPPQIKLFTSNAETEILNLAKKVKLDGVMMENDDARISAALQNGIHPKYQLLKYYKKDGVVSIIDTATDVGAEAWENPGKITDKNNSLSRWSSKLSIVYKSGAKQALPNVPLNRAILFAVPQDLATAAGETAFYDDESFSLLNYTTFADNRSFTADVFDYDENYMPKAIVLYDNSAANVAKTLVGNEDPYIVTKVLKGRNKEGNFVTLIQAYGKGLYEDLYIDEAYADVDAIAKSLSPGDVIRFVLNNNGYVVGLSKDIDFDETSYSATIGGTGTDANYPYYVGRALRCTGSSLSLRVDAATDESNLGVGNYFYLYCDTSTNYIVFDTNTGEAYKASYEDVITAGWDDISSAPLLVTRLLYSWTRSVYIYIK